jgi:hypothetical protein
MGKDERNKMAVASKLAQQQKFHRALQEAQAAGLAAGLGEKPPVMVVYSPKVPFFDESPDLSQPVYEVPDGPCGFGWVNVKPSKGEEGKEARQFLNWLRGSVAPVDPSLAPPSGVHKDYYSGWNLWCHEHGQSYYRKMKNVAEVAKVLNAAIPGLNAYSGGRLD